MSAWWCFRHPRRAAQMIRAWVEVTVKSAEHWERHYAEHHPDWVTRPRERHLHAVD
jgi:hypothetical protein